MTFIVMTPTIRALGTTALGIMTLALKKLCIAKPKCDSELHDTQYNGVQNKDT